MGKVGCTVLIILVVCLCLPMNIVFAVETYDVTPPWFSGLPSCSPYGTLNDPHTLPGLTYTFWCTVEDNQTPQTALLVDLNISICEGSPLPKYPIVVPLVSHTVQDQYVYHKLVNPVRIPDDEVRMFRFVFTVIDEHGLVTRTEQYVNVISNSPTSRVHAIIEPFHGVTVRAHQAAGYYGRGFTKDDYQRLKRWGMNTILFEAWWGMIEENENAPYVYNEDYLAKLETQMNLAKQYGLYPFIAVRFTYGLPPVGTWRGWPIRYSYDLVNLNLPDASGTGGRDRFIKLWEMLATRFPDTGMCISFFPYHRESRVDAERIRELYEITLPTLYHVVRAVTDEYIIVNPLLQSQSGSWNSGLTTGQYNIVEDYGWPFTDDPKLLYGFNNHGKADNLDVAKGESWNYDYQRLADHYRPLEAFKNKYDVTFVCCESFSMVIHNQVSERPINPSRLDWMETHLAKMRELNLGWFYYKYINPASVSSPIESDDSDNAVASLITEYSSS